MPTRTTKLFIVFIAALILDGLMFPAFLGWRDSLLSLLVPILAIIYIGPAKRYVFYGLFFYVVSEVLRGLNFGELMLPFLIAIIVTFLIQWFLDIKHTYDTRFIFGKLVLSASMLIALVYLVLFFYGYGRIDSGYFNPIIILTIVLEALALVFVFSFMFNKKSDYL